MMRGCHIDLAILGAMEVDEGGSIANWMVPRKVIKGMGGAMDLVAGAKRVIVAMEHVTRSGEPKVLRKCRLPLTGLAVVNAIITDMAVLTVTPEGLVLKEVMPGYTASEVQARTEAQLILP
jgi:3-oxoacid CoA-transferase subunit B